MTDHRSAAQSASTGELISQLSQQVSTLVRDEVKLAQLELSRKAKLIGLGAGLLGGAAMIAWLGVAAMVAAAILALANAVAPWLAAVIVGLALLVVAAIVAVVGKREVSAGIPPVPDQAIQGVRRDVETVKESAHQ
jgi:uncharacterized membrane protein YqjE